MQLETQRPVSIIVVTYNSASVLPPLLDSVQDGLAGVDKYAVVIVDNDSRDGSAELAEAHRVGPTVIRMGRNAGYAAAINAGTAVIDPRSDILILNPDLRLYPHAVKPLMELTDDPSVGVAVPRNFKEDQTTDPTLRQEPSIITAWAEAILGGKLAARIGLGEIVGDLARYDVRRRIEWATGSALLVSSRARAAVGAWDESYFLYSEEVDYQRRVREAGFDIVYEPRAEVMHAGGESGVNPRLFALLTANRIRYYGRNHGRVATWLFRLGIVVGEALRYHRGSVHKAGLRSAIYPARCARDFLANQPG
ncbi:glycosyltransferase [Mesorhizobium yinganensis]|uniref:glycosyltransferase n=1 Tax=Mesorhizobium yinganensis TaxID=3157707 RepID=UPI0032B78F8D